nr:reverse transcriptase domain-containing protein [Tanacetum cinerariifolium]
GYQDVLRILTILPSAENLSIPWAVDGTAYISRIPCLLMMPLYGDNDLMTMKFIHAFVEWSAFPIVNEPKLSQRLYSFSTKTGYDQIQIAEANEEKTTFHTSQGVYCYTKMPFGFKNAGATYQRLVDKDFDSQVGRNIEVYVDDLVIKSHTEIEMLRDIDERSKKSGQASERAKAIHTENLLLLLFSTGVTLGGGSLNFLALATRISLAMAASPRMKAVVAFITSSIILKTCSLRELVKSYPCGAYEGRVEHVIPRRHCVG